MHFKINVGCNGYIYNVWYFRFCKRMLLVDLFLLEDNPLYAMGILLLIASQLFVEVTDAMYEMGVMLLDVTMCSLVFYSAW